MSQLQPAPIPNQYTGFSAESVNAVNQLVSLITNDKNTMQDQNNIVKQDLTKTKEQYTRIQQLIELKYNDALMKQDYGDALVTLMIMSDIEKEDLMKFNVSISAGLSQLQSKTIEKRQVSLLNPNQIDKLPVTFSSEKYKRVFACEEQAGLLDSCTNPRSMPFYMGLTVCCRPFHRFLQEHHDILRTHYVTIKMPSVRQQFRRDHAYFDSIEDRRTVPQYMHIYFLHRYLPDDISTYLAHDFQTFARKPELEKEANEKTYITWYSDKVPGTHYYKRLILIATIVQFVRFMTILFMELYIFHKEHFINLMNASNLKDYQKDNPVESFTIIIKTLIYLSLQYLANNIPKKFPGIVDYHENAIDFKSLCSSNGFHKLVLHRVIQQEMTYIDAMDYYDRKTYGVTFINRMFNDIPNDKEKKEFLGFFKHMFDESQKAWESSWNITQPMYERFITCILMSNVFELSDEIVKVNNTKLFPLIHDIVTQNQGVASTFKEVQQQFVESEKLAKESEEDTKERIKRLEVLRAKVRGNNSIKRGSKVPRPNNP